METIVKMAPEGAVLLEVEPPNATPAPKAAS